MRKGVGRAVAVGTVIGLAVYSGASYWEYSQVEPPYASYEPGLVAAPRATQPPSPQPSVSKKLVVVLDPGHGANKKAPVDAKTGYDLNDWNNPVETDEVWVVAQSIQKKLSSKYTVVFTKKTVNEALTFRDRVDRAAASQAALAVSIHTDHNNPSMQWVTPQKTGKSRGAAPGKVITFTDTKLACVSSAYAESIRKERQNALGSEVIMQDLDFTNRGGTIAPGTMSWLQLLAGTEGNSIPWVYNEFGGKAGTPLTKAQLDAYAAGIAKGIDEALSVRQATLKGCGY